jgi:hypothetical protein
VNPYLAGGLFADYLARGRHHLIPKNPQMLAPDNLCCVDSSATEAVQNPDSAGAQVPSAAVSGLSGNERKPPDSQLRPDRNQGRA